MPNGHPSHSPIWTSVGMKSVSSARAHLTSSFGGDLQVARSNHSKPRANRVATWTLASMLAVLGAVVTAATTTVAEGNAWAADRDDKLTAALKKFDEGRAAFDAGSFEDALNAFQASNTLSPSPNSRLFMARCYRALNRVASAYTQYRFAVREAQERLGTTGEKRYAATRDAANSEAAELEPKVPRLTISVPADAPKGLVVKRNGSEVESAAWGVAVETDTGPVLVEASGPRIKPFRQSLALKEGEQAKVDVALERLPTASVAIHFERRPSGMTVSLDGVPLDPDKSEAIREIDAGHHRIDVLAPGYLAFRWENGLRDGESVKLEIDLRPDPHAGGSRGTPRCAFFAVGGLAVASLGTATGLAVHAYSGEQGELDKSVYARDPDKRTTIRSESTAANVLFVAGGLSAIGATVLAFTTSWKTDTKTTALTVGPWVDGGGGVSIHVRF